MPDDRGALGTQFAPREPLLSSEQLSRVTKTIQPGFHQLTELGTLFGSSDSAGSLSGALQDTEEKPSETNGVETSPGRLDPDNDEARPATAANKSTWNLRIRRRSVAGHLSGIRNQVPADPAERTGLQSALVPDDSAPEYEIGDQLGAGTMGIVYCARQTSLNRDLAVKTLKPDLEDPDHTQAAFVSEAVVTAHLVHPNIVPVHDLGQTTDGKLFYSMKHVGGTSWDNTIRDNTLDENLDILLKVCDGVAYAHTRGVVNRDLKPENVMVGDFGEVLVLDWGLAVTTPRFEAANSIQIDHRGQAGTPAYMAPELADPDIRRVAATTDIYLLGAILFEIVEGFPPHLLRKFWTLGPGRQLIHIYQAVLNNEIETDVANKGELMQIACKAMQTRPEDRHQSVEELQEALREYRITGSAEEIMQQVEHKGTASYSQYQTAVALYDEALRKWPRNPRAIAGNQLARRGYAQLALQKGDLDLGLEVIAAGQTEADPDLRIRRKLKKSRRSRRVMKVTWGLMTVAAVVFALYAGQQNRVAQEQEARAVTEAKKAEDNAQEAQRQEKIAQDNAQEAKKQEARAVAEAKNADDNAKEAKKQEARAVAEAKNADDNAKEAKKQEAIAVAKAKELLAKDKRLQDADAELLRARFDGLLEEIDAKLELAKYEEVRELGEQARALYDADEQEVISSEYKQALEGKLEKATKGANGNAAISFPGDGTVEKAVVSADGKTRLLHTDHRLTAFRQSEITDSSESRFDLSLPSGSRIKDLNDIAVSQDGSGICAIDRKQWYAWKWTGVNYDLLESAAGAADIRLKKCLISANHLYLLGRDRKISVLIQSLDGNSEPRLVTLGKRTTDFKGFHDAVLLPDETGFIITAKTGDSHFVSLVDDNERTDYPKLAGLQKRGRQDRFEPKRLFVSQDGSLLGLVGDKDDAQKLIFARRTAAAAGEFPFTVEPSTTDVVSTIGAHAINAVAFSSDNKRIVTAVDRYLQIWDWNIDRWTLHENEDWYEEKVLGGHASDILAVSFQAETKSRLVSVSEKSCRTWNTNTYAEYRRSLLELIDDEQPVSAEQPATLLDPPTQRQQGRDNKSVVAAVQLRSRYLLTSAQNTSQNTSPIRIQQGRNIYSARFSSDGRRFVVGANDLAAHAFDSVSGERTLHAAMSPPRDLFFSPEQNIFLEGHIPEIVSLQFLPPQGELLLTFDYFGSVSVWDATDDGDGVGYERSRLLTEDPSCEVVVSSDGQWIIASGLNREKSDTSADTDGHDSDQYCAVIWETSQILEDAVPQPHRVLQGPIRHQVTATAFSADPRHVVTATRRGTLVLWDVQSGDKLAQTTGTHGFDAVSGIFFSKADEIITAGFDGRVFRRTIENGQFREPEEITRPEGERIPDFIIRLRPNPDGSGFITSDLTKTSEGEYQLNLNYCTREGNWKPLPAGTRIQSTDSDRSKPYRHDVSWSSDGSKVLYVHEDRLLIINTANWKVTEGFRLPQDKQTDSKQTAVRGTFAPGTGGPQRVATFDGRFAHLWDLKSRKHVTEFRSHGPEIHASFSADRKYVATASDSLRVFHADEANERHGQPVFRLSRRVAGRRPFADIQFRPPVAATGQGPPGYTLSSIDGSGNLKGWKWTPGAGPPLAVFFETGEAETAAAGEWIEDENVALSNSLRWSEDGQYLAAIRQGRLELWVVTDQGPQQLSIPLPDDVPVSELALNTLDFSHDGSLLTAAGARWNADEEELVSYGFLWRLALNGAKLVRRIDATEQHDIDSGDEPAKLGITAIAIDDRNQELLTGGSDGILQRWVIPTEPAEDSTAKTLAHIISLEDSSNDRGHGAAVTALDVDAVHGKLLSADANGQLFLWPADR